MKHFTIETKKENAEATINVEVTWEGFAPYRAQGVKRLQKEIALPGFRKGSVPESMLTAKLGEGAILEEAAQALIEDNYREIIEDQKLTVLAQPRIGITKIAPNNPLSFVITVPLTPEVDLGDYINIAQKINKEKEEVNVTDADINTEIERIRKDRAHAEAHKHDHDHEHDGEHNHDHSDHSDHDHPLPEFNDEFVKSLGDFKDVADFKQRLKEHMLEQKKIKAIEKKRIAMIDGIIEASTITIPRILVESELDRMYQQFEGDISRMGIPVADYLGHIKKTADDLKKEWENDAVKRVKTDIILGTISEKEKITADKEKVESEMKAIAEAYKEADPLRVKLYVEHMLTNQAVFDFLEKQN